jgi:hypothetical protein
MMTRYLATTRGFQADDRKLAHAAAVVINTESLDTAG